MSLTNLIDTRTVWKWRKRDGVHLQEVEDGRPGRARPVERVHHQRERPADDTPVHGRGGGDDGHEEDAGEKDGEAQPLACLRAQTRLRQRDAQHPDPHQLVARVVVDVFLRVEAGVAELRGIAGLGHEAVALVMDGGGEHVRIRQQGAEDQLDLLVGHVPERLRDLT